MATSVSAILAPSAPALWAATLRDPIRSSCQASWLQSSFLQRRLFLAPSRVGKSRQQQVPQGASRQGCRALQNLADAESRPVHDPQGGGLAALPALPGVYAVYDADDKLQYVGLTRKLSTSIANHSEELPDLCKKVKVLAVSQPDRESLQAAWKSWIEEHIQATGEVPPGNQQGEDKWTKRRVQRTKPEIRLTPGPHVKLTVPVEQILDKIVKDCKVVAFIKGTRTAPQCGFSHRVLTILNEHRADFETVNVLDEDHNPGLRDAIKAYSQWPTIPQVYIKGEFVGGADIMDELAQKGELASMLRT